MKTKAEKLPAWLPAWANEPLKFASNPDAALRRCAYNKLPQKAKLTPKRRR
jgi:hypothetical protein